MAVASDILVIGELLSGMSFSAGDRKIFPFDFLFLKLGVVPCLQERNLDEEHKTCCFTVKTVNIADRRLDAVVQLVGCRL